MGIFTKFIQKFQVPTSMYQEAAYSTYGDTKIILKPTSVNFLQPGDLITFNYDGEWRARRYLVVSCKRGPDGNFTAPGTGNWLLCAFKIVETLPGMELLFQTLYKDRISSRYFMKRQDKVNEFTKWYQMPNTSNRILGYYNFRTFIIPKMKNMYEIEVKQTNPVADIPSYLR